MNEVKQYLEKLLSEIKINRPAKYEDSFRNTIKTIENVDQTITYAENMMRSYEKMHTFGYKDDVVDRQVAIYQVFVALKKVAAEMSDFPSIYKLGEQEFDSVTIEQIDNWFERFKIVREKVGDLNSRFASRPEK